MAKKRVDMSSLFGDDAEFNPVGESKEGEKDIKDPAALVTVSAPTIAAPAVPVVQPAAPEGKKKPVIMANHKTINTEKEEKKEVAKVTFTPDAVLWEEVLLLAEKQGKKQIEFLTSVLKKEVDANRPVIDKMKALKKQMQNL